MYDEKEIKYLHPNEIERLFKIIAQDSRKHAIRNKAIFYLGEYCALRISELGLLMTDFFNPITREIYCRRSKHGNNNTLRIIDDNVYNSLINYLKIRNEQFLENNPFLFPSNRGTPISRKMLDVLMKEYCKKADIPKDKAHFHALRHSRAIELAESGFNSREIQYWLGHKDIRNTEIYLQFTSKQYDLLYQKLSNKNSRPR